jgi:hypothetical protein
MDSFVTLVAVAAWLLLMVPAAFVMFLNGSTDTEERPTQAALALVPRPETAEREDRIAA